MSSIDAPGPAPTRHSPQNAVENVQRVQQQIMVLNTRYGHVLGQFNMALQRLGTHVASTRPLHATAWDTRTTQLAQPVDRLARELEELTVRLNAHVKRLRAARTQLDTTLATDPVGAATAPAAAPIAPRPATPGPQPALRTVLRPEPHAPAASASVRRPVATHFPAPDRQ